MGFVENSLGRFGYQRKSGQPAATPQTAAPQPTTKAANMSTGAGAWFDIFGGGNNPAFSSFSKGEEQLASYTDWVYGAAHKIAEEVASIDIKLFVNNTPLKNAMLSTKMVYDKKTVAKYLKEKKTVITTRGSKVVKREVSSLEEVENHPLLDLLGSPNPFMTKDEFFEMTLLHLELTGDSFWAVNRDNKGVPNELWPLMPNLVSVVPDKEKFIIGYVYTVNGTQVPFSPDDVIHHKYANPSDFRRGMSTVMAAARAIDTDAHAADYNRKFFYNSAQPDAILYTDTEIDEKAYKRLRSEWDDTYKGTGNSHRTAILENGLKYQQISLTQREMDFLAARNFNRDMILALFGVPKSIIGLDESMSRANAETADYVFTKGKIRPKMLRLVNRITQDLAVQFDENIVVGFTDPVPDDKEFMLKQERQLVNVTHTVNEFRSERGYEPVAGGDELYIASNMIPIAQLSKLNQQAELDDLEKDKIDTVDSEDEEDDDIDKPEGNAAPGTGTAQETGAATGNSKRIDGPKTPKTAPKPGTKKPIHGQITEKDKKTAAKLTAKLNENLETSDSSKKKDEKPVDPRFNGRIYGSFEERAQKANEFIDIRDRITDKYEGDFLKAAKKRFDDQKAEVIKNLNKRFKTYTPKKVKGKLPKQTKAQLDDLFDPNVSIEAWAAAFSKIYPELNAEMGQAAMDFVGSDADYEADTPDFTTWLEQRTGKIAGSIDEETVKQLRAALAKDLQEGKTVGEMIDTVENIYGAAAGFRAERIARTEGVDASTWSTLEGWQQSGLVEGKEWYTADNPCEFCESMQNETIFINDNFASLGDEITGTSDGSYEIAYTDVIGPPLHPNCRCTLLPVISINGSPLD